MIKRKYLKSGNNNPHGKKEVDIEAVDRRIAAGETIKSIAEELDIHPGTLYRKRREYHSGTTTSQSGQGR